MNVKRGIAETCVLSSFPESLKVKNQESDRYISGGKVWVDRCDVTVMRNTRPQDSITHRETQTSAECESYVRQV